MSRFYLPTKSFDDWKHLLADPKQWKANHSAYELASCWENANDFPPSIKNVFLRSNIPLFMNIEMVIGIPEHRVPLLGGGRPSQNDLWVLGRSGQELLSIAVEGKVKESFGPTLRNWLKEASAGKEKRLKQICSILGLSMPLPDLLRYQLLHRTASAMLEAERFTAKNALMMVHSFSSENIGFKDYIEFLNLFRITAQMNIIQCANVINDVSLYFCWIGE